MSASCYLLWTWYQVGSIQCDILSNVQDIFFQVVLFRSGNGWQICLFLVLWRVCSKSRETKESTVHQSVRCSFVIVITCVSVAERDERANVVNSIWRLLSFKPTVQGCFKSLLKRFSPCVTKYTIQVGLRVKIDQRMSLNVFLTFWAVSLHYD